MSKFKTTSVLTLAAIGLGLMSATAYAGKITFVSWGGSYTASQVKACIEPYEAKTPHRRTHCAVVTKAFWKNSTTRSGCRHLTAHLLPRTSLKVH